MTGSSRGEQPPSASTCASGPTRSSSTPSSSWWPAAPSRPPSPPRGRRASGAAARPPARRRGAGRRASSRPADDDRGKRLPSAASARTRSVSRCQPELRWDGPAEVREDLVEDWRTRLAVRYPRAAGAPVRRAWAGFYDMTPDAHPIIGPSATASTPRAASPATASCSRRRWGTRSPPSSWASTPFALDSPPRALRRRADLPGDARAPGAPLTYRQASIY